MLRSRLVGGRSVGRYDGAAETTLMTQLDDSAEMSSPTDGFLPLRIFRRHSRFY